MDSTTPSEQHPGVGYETWVLNTFTGHWQPPEGEVWLVDSQGKAAPCKILPNWGNYAGTANAANQPNVTTSLPWQYQNTWAAGTLSSVGIGGQAGNSYPDNNPKTAFGAKKLPLEYVPPSAMHALAEAFADGAKKYGPYNWREKSISSSVYYGAALRHLTAWWDGEDNAEDSRLNHLHHALACIAMLIDGKSVGKLNDNRPPRGAAAQMQKDWISACKGKE